MAETTRRSLYIRAMAGGAPASFWKGSRATSSIPEDAILTEDSIPIRTELDQYLLTES